MVEIEDQFVAEGAQIIWVYEEELDGTPGTAEGCMQALDVLGDSQVGWCVGDGSTLPVPEVFDASPFAKGRGFDIIVRRQTMVIEYTTNHGKPEHNDNLTGEELLADLKALNE